MPSSTTSNIVTNSQIMSKNLKPDQPKDNDNKNIHIYVSNVVCAFSTKCHLNLRRIALEGINVEYRREKGMLNMRLRKPQTTASIWPSGKIICTGATSEKDAYTAARRYCRLLQRLKFKVRFSKFRCVNVLASCVMPFTIDLNKIANDYQKECSYEPELNPGATFKIKDLRATLKIFTTGSITMTVPNVQTAQKAINYIYPILCTYSHDIRVKKPFVSSTDLNNNNSETQNLNQKSEKTETLSKTIELPIVKEEVKAVEKIAECYSYRIEDSLGYLGSSSYDIIAPSSTTITAYALYENSTMYNDNSNSEHIFGNTDTMMSTASYYSVNNNASSLMYGGGSQSSHWFNDNLLIDNVLEDFLP